MEEALYSFAGALIGSLVTLLLARYTASEQAIGQQQAERRFEVLEHISIVTSEIVAFEKSWGTYGMCDAALPEALLNRLVETRNRARLYVDDSLLDALEPMRVWLQRQAAIEDRPQAAAIDQAAIRKLEEMLVAAVNGEHQRKKK